MDPDEICFPNRDYGGYCEPQPVEAQPPTPPEQPQS